MRTLIIDNEPALIRGLEQLLTHYCPGVELIGTANGVATGKAAIQELQPDLVFLDVEMDDGTGMDLMEQLPQRDFQLVFVTAYDHYALDAFKFSAIDYLLKPVDPDELLEAVRRAEDRSAQDGMQAQLSVLLANMTQPNQKEKKIVLSDAENLHIVSVVEIVRCLAEGAYTRFFLQQGEEILVSKNLKAYEQLLADYGFFRPHHSHLINLSYIKRFSKADGGMLIMQDESQLPVASRRKAMLLERLGRL
ncbi:MAG: LytTR family DNA-binding domain-containing protein [Bacteroidota bacterium]